MLVGINCAFALAPAVGGVLAVSYFFLGAVNNHLKASAITIVDTTAELPAAWGWLVYILKSFDEDNIRILCLTKIKVQQLAPQLVN